MTQTSSIPASLPVDNFPAIAKYLLKNPSEDQQQQEIQAIFSQTTARVAFESWSKANQFNRYLGDHSAFIARIKHVSQPREKENLSSYTTYGVVYSYATWLMGYPAQPAKVSDDLSLENWILQNNCFMLNDYFMQKMLQGWKDDDFALILGYLPILDRTDLRLFKELACLLAVDDQSGATPLSLPIFTEFAKSYPDAFITLLSTSNVIFEPQVFKEACRIMKNIAEIDHNTPKKLLRLQDSEGDTLLHLYFKELLPILSDLLDTVFKRESSSSTTIFNVDSCLLEARFALMLEILSVKDKSGLTPLHYKNNFALFANGLLEKLAKKNVNKALQILAITDLNNQSLLGYPENLAATQSFFEGYMKGRPTDTVQLLSMKNNGLVLIHRPDLFLAALPLFKRTSDGILSSLWSLKDYEGRTPLHNPENLANAIQEFGPEAFGQRVIGFKIFENRDVNGKTLLHDKALFTAARPIHSYWAEKKPAVVQRLFLTEDLAGATPLDQLEIFLASLPILKRLANHESDFLTPILSRIFDGVSTYLHKVERFQKLLPVLEAAVEKHLADVLSMLSKPNAQGKSPLDFPENARNILPLISKIVNKKPKQFFLSFCYESSDNNGWICTDYFVVIMTTAATLDVNLFITLCGLKDAQNIPLFDNCKNIFKFSPLLHNLVRTNPKLFWRLIGIGKADEEFPLHHPDNVNQRLLFLQDLALADPALFFHMLKIPNAAGLTPMHKLSTLASLMPLLEQLCRVNTKLLSELLMLRDSQGNTALHIEKLQSSLRTSLIGLAQERSQYFHEVIIQKNGLEKTPLHSKAFFQEFKNLIKPGEIDFEGLIDNFGLKPGEEESINLAWMKAPKIDYAIIPLQEYDKRMLALEEGVLKIFVVLAEAYQAVLQRKNEKELEQFNAYLQIGTKIYPPVDLIKPIGIMLERIASKRAWLGTHPEGTIPTEEQLRQFYSPLIINFELIVNQLRERKNPLYIAAKMTAVARAQVEGRCATAYEQELDDASKDAKSMLNANALVNPVIKAANSYLNNVLQIVSSKRYGANTHNVHPKSQMQYLLGFKTMPDSYRQDITFEILLNDFKPYLNLKDFTAAINDQVQPEMLIELLMMQIPENYRPEMKKLAESIRPQEEVIEQEIIDEIKRGYELCGSPLKRLPLPKILKRGIRIEDVTRVIEAFFSVRQEPLGGAIGKMTSREFTPEALFHAVYEKLKETPLIETVFKEKNITTFQPMTTQEIQEQQEQLRRAAFKVDVKDCHKIGEVESQLLAAEAIVTMLNQFDATPAQKMVILKAKKRYEEEMTILAEKLNAPVAFSIKRHVRPSQTAEENRRYSYEQEILKALTPTQLAFKCLVQYGVFELKQWK